MSTPATRLTDHLPAQIRLAMDGYFYMAVGDSGFYGGKSNVDGSAAELRGGGLVRIRPDGTGLEVYATGTRNHLDVSIDPEDEMFTYDNTDDGHGWWTRFTHMVDGGFYGYPYDYKPEENRNDPNSRSGPSALDASQPYKPYTLWRAAEYGGGSPTGAIGYDEDALPPEYRGNLFHCEWGKGKVQRFVVERAGGTFKVVKQEDLLMNAGRAAAATCADRHLRDHRRHRVLGHRLGLRRVDEQEGGRPAAEGHLDRQELRHAQAGVVRPRGDGQAVHRDDRRADRRPEAPAPRACAWSPSGASPSARARRSRRSSPC